MSGGRDSLAALLVKAAADLGVALSEAQVERFLDYLGELRTWSAKVNLTAIREPRDIILKHFADSLALLPHLARCASLLDVGSGAGLPGLALKIARPDLRLISVEARRRKVSFQEHVVRRLDLADVEVIWGRLEPGSALLPEGAVDCAVSRALALPDFLTAAAPFVRPGGLLVAMRGREGGAPDEELLSRLGLEVAGEVSYRLPVIGDERGLVLFRKHGGR
jgi:16S rRNA (guanine527-N7)-methyltransferase